MARWLSLILLLAQPIVGIRVSSRVVPVNGAVRVTCLVPRRASNRLLRMELNDYRSSEWELEGEASPQVFEATIEHVPCVVHTAACIVVDELGKASVASTGLLLAGCEGP